MDAELTRPKAAMPAPHHVVDCAVYVDGRRLPKRWTHTEAMAELRRQDHGFIWIGLHEPDPADLEALADTFGLHELAVEDAITAHQRPKLQRFDNILFTVLKTVTYVQHASPTTTSEIVESGEIMAFLGKDFIITVRHGQHASLRDLRKELEATPERLRAGPSAVLHAIAQRVIDNYLKVTESFEADMDEIESLVFAPRSPISPEQMYLMKREVLELRRAVMPLAMPLKQLVKEESALIPPEVRSYFRDVADDLSTVAEEVASFDSLLTTLVDATLAKVTLQQNTDMRRITSWAAIIAVPTLAVGVYGMNFDYMPELHWRYGYPLVIAAIGVACLVLHRIFVRNKWL